VVRTGVAIVADFFCRANQLAKPVREVAPCRLKNKAVVTDVL
jgi:hypothetical protein